MPHVAAKGPPPGHVKPCKNGESSVRFFGEVLARATYVKVGASKRQGINAEEFVSNTVYLKKHGTTVPAWVILVRSSNHQ